MVTVLAGKVFRDDRGGQNQRILQDSPMVPSCKNSSASCGLINNCTNEQHSGCALIGYYLGVLSGPV